MYEKLARPGKLGKAADPSIRDNFSPYKWGPIHVMVSPISNIVLKLHETWIKFIIVSSKTIRKGLLLVN